MNEGKLSSCHMTVLNHLRLVGNKGTMVEDKMPRDSSLCAHSSLKQREGLVLAMPWDVGGRADSTVYTIY